MLPLKQSWFSRKASKLFLNPAGFTGRVFCMDTSRIANFLTTTVSEQPGIYGARLGGQLMENFPALRNDPTYPGLAKFIGGYCNNLIGYPTSDKSDYFYQTAGEPISHLHQNLPQTSPPSLWDAFQNPSTKALLYINPSNGILRISKENLETGSDDFVEISKVTPDEHRGIAISYTQQKQDIDPAFIATLDEKDYWTSWSRMISKSSHYKEWLSFRFTSLEKIFSARLETLDISEDIIRISLQKLVSAKIKPAPERKNPSKALQIETNNSNSSDGSARDLIITIISSMSERELRSIWLPAGDVIDAIRGKRN